MANSAVYSSLTNTIGFDSDLRPTSITAPGVESLAFAYDAADRITQTTNGIHASHSQGLGYDALGRLASVSSTAHSASYSYDADGNRIHQVVNGQATSFVYPGSSNRLQAASGAMNVSYGYNANGDTTTVNGFGAYQYDPFGRLSSASGAAFVVNAEDQRLRKTFGGSTTYFIPDAGGNLLADNQDGTWRDYVWLNGRMVAMITDGGVYSLHGDQTGRVLAISSPTSHAVVWEAHGLPFDRNTIAGSAAFFRLGFPGQYWDSEDNLWHNRYRDYDYQTGRYIQSDPIGLAGGVNTYAYVGNNPISNIDPLGLCDDHKCGTPPALPPGASIRANIQQIQMDRAFAGAELILEFYNLVRNRGPWDYKQQGHQYQDAGNFNYGVTGAAAGFSTQLLLRAAGYAQIKSGTSTPAWRGLLGPLGGPPYGDDPSDQAVIKAGIAYYNCVASGDP